MSIELNAIVKLLNGTLSIPAIPDAPGAQNGLQLENNGAVTRVAVAVDGSEQTIRAALDMGADLLILHHGIFWQKMIPVTGISYRKLKLAMDGNLAIYSAHLPLDIHPVYGNNALLAKACGITPGQEGVDYHGVSLGTHGVFNGTCAQLKARMEDLLGAPVTAYWAHGADAPAGDVFICSGGAGDEICQAAALGCRTYVTGEGSHWNIPMAAELGMNIIYGGHYHTETFGVKALGALLKEIYGLDYAFIDMPPAAYSH